MTITWLTVFVSCICSRLHQSETGWQSRWVQWPPSSTAPAHSWDCLRGRHSGSCPGRCSRQMEGHRGHWGTRLHPPYSTCPGSLPYIYSDSMYQSCGSGVCPHKDKFHELNAKYKSKIHYQFLNSFVFNIQNKLTQKKIHAVLRDETGIAIPWHVPLLRHGISMIPNLMVTGTEVWLELSSMYKLKL